MKYIMKLNYTNEIQEGSLEHSTTRKLHITEAHARLYIHSLQQFNFVNHIIYTHQSTHCLAYIMALVFTLIYPTEDGQREVKCEG